MAMKFLIVSLLLLGLAAPARAIDKAELDKRILRITAKFEEMQAKPDKRIPAENLRKAKGIILLDRTKARLHLCLPGRRWTGHGERCEIGEWGPPAFVSANEASLGFQIGGQQSFVVILLMNTNATRALTESKFDFGGEASGTAGNSTGKAEAPSPPTLGQVGIRVYSDSTGLYGGASIKGGDLLARLGCQRRLLWAGPDPQRDSVRPEG